MPICGSFAAFRPFAAYGEALLVDKGWNLAVPNCTSFAAPCSFPMARYKAFADAHTHGVTFANGNS